MAHNAYVGGSLAGWALGTGVSAAKFWAIDEAQFKSINGDDGGVWAPTGTITIGGQGLNLTTTFTCATALLYGEVIEIGRTSSSTDNLYVNATAAFNQSVLFNGLTVTSGGNTVVALGGTLSVTKTATFSGLTALNGTTTVSAPVSFTDTATFASTVTVGAAASEFKNNGRQVNYYAEFSVSGNTTATYTSATLMRYTSLNGAGRILALDATLFSIGTTKVIRNDDSTYSLTINDATLGLITTLTPATSGLFVFDGNYWRLMLKGT